MRTATDQSRPPTVHDVAELAGVSTATVSRVLNNSGRTSEGARSRVLEAVRRLDYVANAHARTMQPGSRSRSWGLIVDDVDSYFFGRMVAELDRAAQTDGSTLFVASTQKRWEREKQLIRELRGRRIDGLFIVPTSGEEDIRDLVKLPAVYMDRFPRGLTDIDVVTFDVYHPIVHVMSQLWRRGHRRFGFIGGNVAADPGSRRLAAWTDFLRDHGVLIDPAMVSTGNTVESQSAQALSTMLDHAEPPTAVVATNNPLLVGILHAVVERRARIEIVASEGLEAAFLSPVPLHVITGDPSLIARAAADRLRKRIQGDTSEAEVTLLPTVTTRFGPEEL